MLAKSSERISVARRSSKPQPNYLQLLHFRTFNTKLATRASGMSRHSVLEGLLQRFPFRRIWAMLANKCYTIEAGCEVYRVFNTRNLVVSAHPAHCSRTSCLHSTMVYTSGTDKISRIRQRNHNCATRLCHLGQLYTSGQLEHRPL